ncbi:MAG: hypothetical protein R3B72_29860 [Polyangiaceae bacterium]
MKNLLWSFALLLTVSACGNHYSTQDAYVACEDLQTRVSTLTDDQTFAECVACYEDCGDECALDESAEGSPFSCPN